LLFKNAENEGDPQYIQVPYFR